MTAAIPGPTLLEGIATIGDHLGLDRGTADDLVRSGLLRGWFAVDGRTAARAGAAQQLARRPYFDPSGPSTPRALVVKVKPAIQVDDQDREYQGWHALLSATEQADGVRSWWSVRDVDEWDGALFVATIAGFVVGVWRITGHETRLGKLHRFELRLTDDDPDARFFVGRRMKPIAGGVTLRLPLRPSK